MYDARVMFRQIQCFADEIEFSIVWTQHVHKTAPNCFLPLIIETFVSEFVSVQHKSAENVRISYDSK